MVTEQERRSHLDFIDETIGNLPLVEAGALGLSCAQRMLPAYSRAATGYTWDATAALSECLHAAWQATLHRTTIARSISERARRSVPPEEAEDTAITAIAFTVSGGIADLLEELARSDGSYSRFTCSRAIEVVEIAESESSDLILQELLRTEINLQRQDVQLLMQCNSKPSVLDDVYRRSLVGSVLGTWWF